MKLSSRFALIVVALLVLVVGVAAIADYNFSAKHPVATADINAGKVADDSAMDRSWGDCSGKKDMMSGKQCPFSGEKMTAGKDCPATEDCVPGEDCSKAKAKDCPPGRECAPKDEAEESSETTA
jgi:hypothetical protein